MVDEQSTEQWCAYTASNDAKWWHCKSTNHINACISAMSMISLLLHESGIEWEA